MSKIKPQKKPATHQSLVKVPDGHSLFTRREFLSHGLIAGAGVTMAPGLLGMLSNRVYAQTTGLNCALPSGNSGKVPFICLDLAGGGSIAGSNFIVGSAGGQDEFLSDYTMLGRPATAHPTVLGVDRSLGIAMHPQSGILNGIMMTTSTTVRSKIDGAIACAQSGDDTSTNPHNPVMWITKYGLSGSLIKIAGTSSRSFGGNSIGPSESYISTARAVRVSNPTEAKNLVSLGQLATSLGKERALKVLKAANRMSVAQLEKFNTLDLPQQIREIASCGYINSGEMPILFTEEILDPALDPTIVGPAGVYAATTAILDDANNRSLRTQASVAKTVLDGFSGSGVIEMGGYDYHGQIRQDQHRKDFEAGQAIGRMFSLAAAKGKSLVIYLYTDGGLTSDGQTDQVQNFDATGAVIGDPYTATRFVNDAGQAGSVVMLYYNHNATRESQSIVRNSRRQVGHFRIVNGRLGVDPTSSILADNVNVLAKWAVLNYLAIHGDEGMLAEVVGDNVFSEDMAKYLVFNKMV
jgi:hypothetical protein